MTVTLTGGYITRYSVNAFQAVVDGIKGYS